MSAKTWLNDYKAFINRGNLIDIAVGLVLGVAFAAITTTLVAEVIMPLVGLLLGGVDFANLYIQVKPGTPAGPYATLEAAKAAGAVVIGYGVLINSIINFLIIAAAVFFMVRGVNRLTKREEKTTEQDCPFCKTAIPLQARRCPHCTSKLAGWTDDELPTPA